MKPGRVLFASLIGTTIEFFDFYIYGTAAVLVFPQLFFPPGNPTTATLQSFATFALAFFARPVGSALFGHFGDRVGRKTTLVAALLTMGLSTVAIGLLPTYAQVGIVAPALLALCRLGQGIGLGGEWGGAVLLAIENAPPEKRAWYGMFPQIGAPIGFTGATAAFIVLGSSLTDAELFEWGWRLPFLASALLVFVGLYVRLKIAETPAFQRAVENNERVRLPMATVLRDHTRVLLLATLVGITTFATFYTMTVFTLSWGTAQLGFPRQSFLWLQIFGMLFFALGILGSSKLADRVGVRRMMIVATVSIVIFGLLFGPLFSGGSALSAAALLSLGLLCLGLEYGPLGLALAELFPTAVRYTGASLAFNVAGILGGSLAPYIATALAGDYGIAAVGYYLSAAALLTLIALLLLGPRVAAREHEPTSEPAEASLLSD
jgi:metabolite-proton symporter